MAPKNPHHTKAKLHHTTPVTAFTKLFAETQQKESQNKYLMYLLFKPREKSLTKSCDKQRKRVNKLPHNLSFLFALAVTYIYIYIYQRIGKSCITNLLEIEVLFHTKHWWQIGVEPKI
jgi:hypothetical protein